MFFLILYHFKFLLLNTFKEFKEIWPYLDMIVDGGVLGIQDPHRKGSTIVDLSMKNFYKIIRPGW